MAIQFPPDAEISTDHRLTLIRVLKELTKDNGRLDELVDAVKRTLKSKGRRYAESELVVADLRGGGGAGPRFVDPHKL
jgi:hypothetical protein